jgi:hypothetical protein
MGMRWFTDAAYDASDAVWREALDAYQEHLTSILERLPPDLASLATDPVLNLHDAGSSGCRSTSRQAPSSSSPRSLIGRSS